MPRALLVLATLVLLASGAFAADGGANDPAAMESGKAVNADDDKLICKRQRVTGSNIPQRTCMTRRRAREMQEHSQRWLGETQGNSARSANPEGG